MARQAHGAARCARLFKGYRKSYAKLQACHRARKDRACRHIEYAAAHAAILLRGMNCAQSSRTERSLREYDDP